MTATIRDYKNGSPVGYLELYEIPEPNRYWSNTKEEFTAASSYVPYSVKTYLASAGAASFDLYAYLIDSNFNMVAFGYVYNLNISTPGYFEVVFLIVYSPVIVGNVYHLQFQAGNTRYAYQGKAYAGSGLASVMAISSGGIWTDLSGYEVCFELYGTDTVETIYTPGVRSLTFTRYAPAVYKSLVPSTRTLSLAYFTPKLTTTITPGARAITFALYSPKLTTTIPTGKGTLSISSYAPVKALTLIPSTSSLAFTRYAISFNLSTGKRALSLSGYAPITTKVLIPAKRSLALTSYIPNVYMIYHPLKIKLDLDIGNYGKLVVNTGRKYAQLIELTGGN